MTEENSLKNVEDSIHLQLNKGRENRLKIIYYFNKLITLADKDNAFVDAQYVDRPSLYENIKSRIIDLKDFLRTTHSLEHYSLLIYELLFIGKNDFNYDKFDKKCQTFELILNILLNKSNSEFEENYMIEVKNEKKVWKSLIDLMVKKMQASAVLFCAFLEYYKTKEQIIAFFLDMLQGMNDYTIKINFKLEDLDNEKEENIAQDFYEIYNDKIQYFQIDYKDSHIVKTPLGEQEIIKAQEEEIGNQFWNGKISDLIEEDPQENIGVDYDDRKKDEGKGTSKNIELDIKGQEEKAKISDGEKNIKNKLEQGVFRANETEMTENMVSSNDINMADNKGLNKEIQELKGIITKMSNAISKLKDENKQQNEDISKLIDKNKQQNEEISNLKKENRIQNNLLLKSKEIRNKDKVIYRQAIRELNEKITNVQDDLNLIKARDAIKSFIDYFYKGFGLKGDIDYRDKASSIATQLNIFNDYNKYDIELINTLRILLIEGGKKIYEDNDLAHNIAISSGGS